MLFSKTVLYKINNCEKIKDIEDWLLFYKRPVFLKIIACPMICRSNDKNPGGHIMNEYNLIH